MGSCPSRQNAGCSRSIKPFKTLLYSRYKELVIRVDASMMEPGRRATVANIHVNLVLLSRTDLRSQFGDHSFATQGDMCRVEHTFCAATESCKAIELASLFQDLPKEIQMDNKVTYRVIAIASAGCGKTTIFSKVAPFKWATDGLWAEDFDLVVAREFRFLEVRQARSVCDLMSLTSLPLDLTTDCIHSVDRFVRSQPHRVCLVLDGIDEAPLSSCSEFMTRVINGEELKGIRLVITGRPCQDIFCISDLSKWDRSVEVVGFRQCEVESYIRNILRAGTAEKLLGIVRQNRYLRTIMATPLLAYEICRLFHFRAQTPECISELFEMMLLLVAEKRCSAKFKCWSEIPEDTRRIILQLGKFAFHMLEKQQGVFTLAELREQGVTEESLLLGLLVDCDDLPGDRTRQYKFSHLTMLENLAAKFKAFDGVLHPGRIAFMVETLGPVSGHLRTFWVLFAAHLNSECLETLVHCLLICGTGVDSSRASSPQLNYMGSTQTFPLNFLKPLSHHLAPPTVYSLAEVLLNGVVNVVSAEQYVRQNMESYASGEDVTSSNVPDFMKELLLIWFTLTANRSQESLLDAISKVDDNVALHCQEMLDTTASETFDVTSSLAHLNFIACKEHHERRLIAFRCFAEHALSHSQRVCPSPSIDAALNHRKGILTVRGDKLPSDCRMLDVILMHHLNSARWVTVANFATDSACLLPEALLSCRELEVLHVCKSPRRFESFCTVIQSSYATMHSVVFTNTALPTAAVEDIIRVCASCPNLRVFNLERCSLLASAAVPIAAMLGETTQLVAFNLDGNTDLGDDAMVTICSSLSNCSQLHRAYLSCCGLSAQSLCSVASAVQHLQSLQRLWLNGNDYSQVSETDVDAFVGIINEHPSLQNLYLPKRRNEKSPASSRLINTESYREDLELYLW